MGSVIGTAAEKVGGAVGNTVLAPFKNMFSKSCEDKCGAWGGWCFIENWCGASLIRMFISYALLAMTVVFLYVLLWKTGLVKCLIKKSCKLSWKAFWGSFRALFGACGFLWRKLRNTRRVYRGRRRDVEMGEFGWTDTDGSGSRKRGRSPVSVRERRKGRQRQSLRVTTSKAEHSPKRSRTERSLHHGHHHHATGPRRMEASSSSLSV